jgi:hypothetical protein
MDCPYPSVAGSANVEVHVFNITSGEAALEQITTVGIDLAKSVVSVHGVDARGNTVLRKTLSAARLIVRRHGKHGFVEDRTSNSEF